MSKTLHSEKLNADPSAEQSTRHFLETYHTEDVIKIVLEEHKNAIVHYAYILHDKDIKDNGTPKVPHWHILLKLSSTRTLKSVQGWFDKYSGANTRNPEPCASIGLSYAYLTHKFNPEKASYDSSLIRSDDFAYFEAALIKADRQRKYGDRDLEGGIVLMFYELCEGHSVFDMVNKWGKTFIVNSRYLYNLLDIAKKEGSL